MRWPITVVVLLLVLAVSLGLYRLESEVQHLERDLASATAKVEDNRRNSRILAAELSFLSQPSRLQALAQRHLALRPMAVTQVGTLASLPLKAKAATDGKDAGGKADAEPGGAANGDGAAKGPPVPGWKPVKPRRGERIVLASRGGRQ